MINFNVIKNQQIPTHWHTHRCRTRTYTSYLMQEIDPNEEFSYHSTTSLELRLGFRLWDTIL